MAIKERGVKRTCQACGGVFYDLLNDPIICPKCGAEYDPESILKSRKTRLPTIGEEEVKIENDDADASDENDIAEVELEEDDNDEVILPDVDDDVDVVEDDPLISDEDPNEELIDND
ncbi:MAG: TIGR02300 family protein [Pseudomonadota bacterium]|nr:TIGR02300 family protein [Pseudomonadota bacterium]